MTQSRFPKSLLLATAWALPAMAQTCEKLSPYPAIRWREFTPEVMVEGAWYELLAINDVPAGDIVSYCRRTYAGDLWKKRFTEDLVEVMSGMGKPPGAKVSLRLRELEGGAEIKRQDVSMTHENRQALRKANNRERNLGQRDARPAARLTGEEVAADLEQLRTALETQYSYLKLRNVDHAAAFAKLRERYRDGGDAAALAIDVQRLMAKFGDGHSRVRGLSGALPRGCLPFAVRDWNGRILAVQADGSLLDADHPVLVELDGLAIDKWLEAAGVLAPEGSPQMKRRAALAWLPRVRWLRAELGRPESPSVQVALAALEGTARRTLTLTVADRDTEPPARRSGAPRLLEGDIGYLPIEQMDDDPKFLDALHTAMSRFREARGLIIDVRGNGGGSRAALRTLAQYFMREDEPPCVANVAAYRLQPGQHRDEPEGYLSNRWLYPAGASVWKPAEREAIGRYAPGFVPEWKPPTDDFSEWHYFVLSRGQDAREYVFAGPVVVLMDGGCFSATDIFLAALKGRPNVRLVGTPSGGGSGRAQGVRLAKSGIELRLSTMASFRPDGKLYDTRGIEPDEVVATSLSDELGRSDSVLDRAAAMLRKPEGGRP